MQWLEDAPEDWESAPEHPPAVSDRSEVTTESLQNGLAIRTEESPHAYIYAQEDTLKDCT